MTGEQLFDSYIEAKTPYANVLWTIFMNIGDQIYPLLDKADKAGKKLAIKEFTDNPDLHDELTEADVILL